MTNQQLIAEFEKLIAEEDAALAKYGAKDSFEELIEQRHTARSMARRLAWTLEKTFLHYDEYCAWQDRACALPKFSALIDLKRDAQAAPSVSKAALTEAGK
jgi:hypothetical protein